jgi:hypothetical protein
MRSGKEWASLMHFTDPIELGGRHVIGRNDVTLGVVEGIYADIRSGYPQWAGRTIPHRYAVSSANRMS